MPNGVPKRKVVKRIAAAEKIYTNKDVAAAVARSNAAALQVVVLDSKYWAVDIDTWKLILEYTGVDQGQYRADRYDCDDFAFAFKAAVSRKLAVNGVGIVVDWSGKHAYNAILVADANGLVIKFIEPQSDGLVIQDEEMYKMDSGFIVF